MSETKTVKTEVVNERQIEWIPKGYTWRNRKTAIIRDGALYHLPQLEAYLVEAGIDGCIEFIQAIKRAMDETAK